MFLKYDIFISHATSDTGIAKELLDAFEGRGFRCWLASRDSLPGEDYEQEIVSAIESSCAILLVFSQSSNESRHVHREIVLADNEGKTIFPLRIESAEPTGKMRYQLAGRQRIDFFSDRRSALESIEQRLLAMGCPVTSASAASLSRIAAIKRHEGRPSAQVAHSRLLDWQRIRIALKSHIIVSVLGAAVGLGFAIYFIGHVIGLDPEATQRTAVPTPRTLSHRSISPGTNGTLEARPTSPLTVPDQASGVVAQPATGRPSHKATHPHAPPMHVLKTVPVPAETGSTGLNRSSSPNNGTTSSGQTNLLDHFTDDRGRECARFVSPFQNGVSSTLETYVMCRGPDGLWSAVN
jgi:hypothetical protein